MAFAEKSKALLDFLNAQAEASPAHAGDYAQMTDLYQRKLWHQCAQSPLSLWSRLRSAGLAPPHARE